LTNLNKLKIEKLLFKNYFLSSIGLGIEPGVFITYISHFSYSASAAIQKLLTCTKLHFGLLQAQYIEETTREKPKTLSKDIF
jgi:hypothetical protein